MSRATVRAGTAAFLDAPAVDGLVKVHTAKPRNGFGQVIAFDEVTPSGAEGYIHIETVDEKRAANGRKNLVYTVALVGLFRTSQMDAALAVGDYDAVIDAIKERLRDKSAGNILGGLADPAIYNAAEQLLQDETDLPPDAPLTGDAWFRVRFDVSEMIPA